jgi:hypothetical protein
LPPGQVDVPETAWLLELTTRCLCAGILARTLELLGRRQHLKPGALLGWHAATGTPGMLSRLSLWLFDHPRPLWVLWMRVGAASWCLALPGSSMAGPLLAALLLSQAYCNYRFFLIAQSADTMFLVGLAAVFVGSLDPYDAELGGVALTFFGLQVMLAYGAAGVDKLTAPAWRNGQRLIEVFKDSANRVEPLGGWLSRHRRASAALSWGVIALEVLLPVSVLLPEPVFWTLLAVGVSFHTMTAVTMGLHGFLWSFGAAYPGIYFVHRWLAH